LDLTNLTRQALANACGGLFGGTNNPLGTKSPGTKSPGTNRPNAETDLQDEAKRKKCLLWAIYFLANRNFQSRLDERKNNFNLII
jgi:hypothetical protein